MLPSTALRIHLLGPMRIERDSVPIRLPRRKVESLLAYLLLHRGQHARDHLATLLWGDSSDTQARHSLRTALATVRQQISPDLLHTDRDHVQLNPAYTVWVDLHELLALEDEIDHPNSDFLQERLALWQGELLAGFYDDWITIAREHYGTRLLKLFLQVTQSLRARSDYAQAIQVAQRVLLLDPANEHAHQHLMFCYVASGDRPAALRQYELCERILEEELDAPPLPETTALYQWIKQYDGDEASPAGKITNLPFPLTSFVGRTHETAEVKRLLTLSAAGAKGLGKEKEKEKEKGTTRTVRLLTLLGAGGSGKTRLSIQAATDLIDSFAHGVWWVELAALSDGELVARAIARALGVTEKPDQTLSETVANALGNKQLLLVLDNCEHLIAACAHVAAELLARCPNLQILATSREPLNITGEILWQVPAFAVPDPAKLTLVDLLLQFESLRLFVERAAHVQPGFALTLENAQAVAEICQRLDGIPLAIELAAARVRVLSVEQIAGYLASALGARFALLTQGSRAVLPRHQTLRATIDWSYDLLDDAERLLFRQAALFQGGFTLGTLEQIVGSAAPGTLDLLTQLVDKSLIIVEPHGGQNRYRLLETLREYALEQFPTANGLKSMQRRHAEVFLHLAAEAGPELIRAQQRIWLDRLEMEHANMRAALGYLIDEGDGENALRLTTALYRFWEYRGYVSEGRAWFEKALAKRTSVSGEVIAAALVAAGWLAHRQGDLPHVRSCQEEALSLFQQVEDEIGIANALRHLALVDMDQGHYQSARERLEQSSDLVRALNYESGLAMVLHSKGHLAWDEDRFADARDYHREGRSIHQRLGNLASVAIESLSIGDAERMLGEFDAAQKSYDETLADARTLGHKGLIAATFKSMSLLAFKQQRYEQARQYGEDALQMFLQLGDKIHIGFALCSLGDVARKFEEYGKAWTYYAQYLQSMHDVGYKWPIYYALEDLAYLLSEAGQHPALAVRLLAAAETLRLETGLIKTPSQQEKFDDTANARRQQLGDAAFDALWQAGESTPLARMVDEVISLTLA